MARLASTENLTSSYDLVLGLVRRPNPSPCRHSIPSTPPPQSRHHHCHCHRNHHCSLPRDRRKETRSRPSSPSPSHTNREGIRSRSRSRPTSPPPLQKQQSKSKWAFVKKAKRSASAERSHRHAGAEASAAVELGWSEVRPGVMGQWEDTGNHGWSTAGWTDRTERSTDSELAANTATLAGDLCRRATALRRTLYKLPGLINQRNDFLEIIKSVETQSLALETGEGNDGTDISRDVASEMKLLLDSAGRLAPNLPDHQRAELDMARRKLLETSRSFSNALKAYFKTPE